MNYKKILFIVGCGLALSLGKVNAQSATFNYTGSTQTWTVPCGVTSITVDVRGAQGGTYGAYTGGLGARIQGTLTVTPSTILTIYVGEQGVASQNAGGGGGGSGIANSGTPLVVAGAGGGASGQDDYNGMPGLTGTSGGSSSGPGGTAGNGGDKGYFSGDCGWAGGGGGFYGNGYGGSSGGDGGALPGTLGGPAAGISAINGGAGGVGGCCGFSPLGSGGWGCGGGGRAEYGGGGGGGYSGGGGGQYRTATLSPGGGGGSYNGGSNQTNTQGYQSGNGQVLITWTLPAALTASATVSTSISCNGGSNGSASSTVTGGGMPYTYAWTGGGTNSSVSGLTAGSYTLTVNDACGNSASASVSITQPTAIVASASVTTNISCNGGNNGSASSTVTGGTGAYTYSWTGGGTNSTVSGLTAGTYNLNVQDANGCTASATVTITQPNSLTVSDSVTANVLCNGDSTGSVSSTVSGGTMPYTYAWTGGGTTDTAVGLTAGSYTLTVQEANGCSTVSVVVTITQPTAIVVVEHTTPDNGSGNGTASVNVSGGVSPYTYAWTGGNTTDSISGKAKGAYCCTVTDANGCMSNVCDTIKSTAGVNNIASKAGQITVYPNPNNGEFTIQSSLNASSVVEVYNVLGEKVFTGNLNSGNNTINMTSQSNGVYLYRVMSESGTLLSEGKISVQK